FPLCLSNETAVDAPPERSTTRIRGRPFGLAAVDLVQIFADHLGFRSLGQGHRGDRVSTEQERSDGNGAVSIVSGDRSRHHLIERRCRVRHCLGPGSRVIEILAARDSGALLDRTAAVIDDDLEKNRRTSWCRPRAAKPRGRSHTWLKGAGRAPCWR